YPDLELLPSIANYFGVTVDHLLSNDTSSKEKDYQIFIETVGTLSDETTETIDFVKEYCRKYPEEDYYAYSLVVAITNHVIGDEEKTKQYMPLLLKHTQRLLETRYRNAVIQIMATVCEEQELDKWLDMTPYSGFSRRYCLICRAEARANGNTLFVQQGLEMLETLAVQLDRRCPDSLGAEKKTRFQKDILKTVRSFGKNDEVPDGWKLFYAYKELVLAACLFGSGKIEEGWRYFDAAIAKCRYVLSMQEEWLEIGGALFSNLKVSKDWNYAIDVEGNRHKLFGIVRLSFYDMEHILYLLEHPRWAWFDAVRGTSKYQAALAWVKTVAEQNRHS
ncbi:MAG: hypothetical protein IJW46_00570, partial [Clostridia bacterium]|nr:hypothetical protein [Clostridia bacterium]